MNKSQRIVLNSDNIDSDKYIKVRLEQSVDTLEFMSMSIDTKDVYQKFNSDYGILVGRVLANDSVGVPNAKISIFIPLSEIDAEDSEISSIYPYTTPREKNNEGKRYNLLPRVAKYDTEGYLKPIQPFGSFPIKEEIVTNVSFLNVYKKYYKYTATTNDSGDYMIYGVPIGMQTVHLSVDITDIGKYSMNPASMITLLGYSEKLFTNDKTRIKPSNNLEDLPHIETQEVSVDIIPFWGDENDFEIGITRHDFRIRSVLTNSFIIFGSVFTDGDNSMWGSSVYTGNRRIRELYAIMGDENTGEAYYNMGMASKRIGNITEKIYYYPNNIINPDDSTVTSSDMMVLYPTDYSVYKEDGVFLYIIPCNRDKIITDILGNEVSVPADYPGGVFTSFKGFVTIENTPDDVSMNFSVDIGTNLNLIPIRYRLKIPQYGLNLGDCNRVPNDLPQTIAWKKQYFTFKSNTIYSVARFHTTTYMGDATDTQIRNTRNPNTGLSSYEVLNQCVSPEISDHRHGELFNGGIIKNDNSIWDSGEPIENAKYELPSNSLKTSGNVNGNFFGANWLNFSLYLPQFGYAHKGWTHIKDYRINSNFCFDNLNPYFCQDNEEVIAADELNNKWFARSDLHYTDFIEVPISDINYFVISNKRGEKIPDTDLQLKGDYRYGLSMKNGVYFCPQDGGYQNGDPNTSIRDNNRYFYRGYKSDCFDILGKIGLVYRQL